MDKINGLFSAKRDRKSEAVPAVPRIETSNFYVDDAVQTIGVQAAADGSPTPTPRLPKMPSCSPSMQAALQEASPSTATTDTSTIYSYSDVHSVQNLSEHVLGKAQRETNPQRKERLLNFAKVGNPFLVDFSERH